MSVFERAESQYIKDPTLGPFLHFVLGSLGKGPKKSLFEIFAFCRCGTGPVGGP